MRTAMQGLYVLSIIGFFTALFWSYLNITSFVLLSKAGIPLTSDYISKDVYFYIFFIKFLIINLPFLYLGKLLRKLPAKLLPIPTRFWGQDIEHLEGLRMIYRNWTYAMMCALNLLALSIAVNIMIVNHLDGNLPIDYEWMYSFSLVILGLSILTPLIRLFIPKLNFFPEK